jgi:hypothetical protein
MISILLPPATLARPQTMPPLIGATNKYLFCKGPVPFTQTGTKESNCPMDLQHFLLKALGGYAVKGLLKF